MFREPVLFSLIKRSAAMRGKKKYDTFHSFVMMCVCVRGDWKCLQENVDKDLSRLHLVAKIPPAQPK